jgi:cbb3-type cytochrome oxidase subunit 3
MENIVLVYSIITGVIFIAWLASVVIAYEKHFKKRK